MRLIKLPLWWIELRVVCLRAGYLMEKHLSDRVGLASRLDGWKHWAKDLYRWLLSGLAVGPGGRAFMALCWYCRILDHTVDGERALPLGQSLAEYVGHRDRLAESMAGSNKTESLMPEDWLLAQVVKYCHSRQLLPNVESELVDMWKDYRPEVERKIAGRVAPTTTELQSEQAAITRFLALCLVILGVREAHARRFASEYQPVWYEADTLNDLLGDIQSGSVCVTEEDLRAQGIDIATLMSCCTWHELAYVAGFRPWYKLKAEDASEMWRQVQPAVTGLRKMVHPRRRSLMDKSFFVPVEGWIKNSLERFG